MTTRCQMEKGFKVSQNGLNCFCHCSAEITRVVIGFGFKMYGRMET